MSATTHIDASRWPLLTTRLGAGVSERQLEDFLSQSSLHLRRGAPFVCITDIRQASLPTARHRCLYAEWIHAHEAPLRRLCLGNATLLTSAPMRLSVSLVLYMVRLPIPSVAVANMDLALEFVLGKLVEGGLESEARRLQRERHLSLVRSG